MSKAQKLMAVLMPGPPVQPALTLTPRMQILDVRNGKPRRYSPKFQDLISIDWVLVDVTTLRPPPPPES